MKLLALPLLLVTLMLPSCSTLTNLQRDLNTMTEAQYRGLKNKVMSITAITSNRLAKNWDTAKRDKARGVITQAARLIVANKFGSLDATNLIRSIADHYSKTMGLDEQARRDIKSAALLVDVVVGPIKLGVDGKLGEREQGLILALLEGLAYGLK